MAVCISPVRLRKDGIIYTYPCQKCNFCLQNRRADWTFRILEQLKISQSAYFITLTYDENHQPYKLIGDSETDRIPTLCKRDIQLFKKRLRKENDLEPIPPNQFDTGGLWGPIKYYTVGEYGTETFRPHYHSIIFNVKPRTLAKLESIWGKGFVVVGQVQPPSVHYVTKYVLNKNDGWTPIEPPFSLISQGMGRNYLHTNGFEHKEALKTFVLGDRGKQRLPRYYRDKIFNIREKELLSKQSIEQNDILYKENIERLQKYHPVPETYHEYCERLRHERIHLSKKSKPSQL